MSDRELKALLYRRGDFKILDQTRLPHGSVWVDVASAEDAFRAIRTMQVRGAPAIAMVACLGLAVEMTLRDSHSKQLLHDFVNDRLSYLETSRPTAVNLRLASQRIKRLSHTLLLRQDVSLQQMNVRLIEEAEGMLEEDVAGNKAMGKHGAEHLLSRASGDRRLTVLTHCNTGSLATAGFGTALGVIRSLHTASRLEEVFYCEARPYMQGSRLTSYELQHEGIRCTLVCDSAVSHLFTTRRIDAVIVGADRITANGDTANKIGTYHIAVSARHHGVDVYVVAPFSSIDFSTASGAGIPIEERPSLEMTHWDGRPVAPAGTRCWNPGFDVTPAALITAVVTERGVFPPSQLPPPTDADTDPTLSQHE